MMTLALELSTRLCEFCGASRSSREPESITCEQQRTNEAEGR